MGRGQAAGYGPLLCASLQTTPQAIQQDLGISAEQFDQQYLAWIDQKYGAEAAHFDEWKDKLKALVAAAEQSSTTLCCSRDLR